MEKMWMENSPVPQAVQQDYPYYKLVAETGPELEAWIKKEREAFSLAHGWLPEDPGATGMVLAQFRSGEGLENTLLRWMHRICSSMNRFVVTVNNFSGIPNHSVFLRVQEPASLTDIVFPFHSIDPYIRSVSSEGIRFSTRPIVPILEGLTEGLYEKAISDYSRKTYFTQVVVDRFTLYRREESSASPERISHFSLKP